MTYREDNLTEANKGLEVLKKIPETKKGPAFPEERKVRLAVLKDRTVEVLKSLQAMEHILHSTHTKNSPDYHKRIRKDKIKAWNSLSLLVREEEKIYGIVY